ARALPAALARRHQLHHHGGRGARAARVARRHLAQARCGLARTCQLASPAMADDTSVPDDAATQRGDGDDAVRDALPAELDVTGLVGPYMFPDNSRRRVPGILYIVVGLICLAVWASTKGNAPVLSNGGVAIAGVGLILFGLYHIQSGWHLAV